MKILTNKLRDMRLGKITYKRDTTNAPPTSGRGNFGRGWTYTLFAQGSKVIVQIYENRPGAQGGLQFEYTYDTLDHDVSWLSDHQAKRLLYRIRKFYFATLERLASAHINKISVVENSKSAWVNI